MNLYENIEKYLNETHPCEEGVIPPEARELYVNQLLQWACELTPMHDEQAVNHMLDFIQSRSDVV